MRNKPTYEDLEQQVNHLKSLLIDHQESRARWQTLSLAIEESSEGVAIIDIAGNLHYSNRAFAAAHGYTVDVLIGKHFSIFHTPQQMPSVEAANRQTVKTGSFKGEIWHVSRDGNVFPALMHNSVVNDDTGNPVYILGMLRDISAQKQLEQAQQFSGRRLALFVDHTPLGVIEWNMDFEVAQWNAVAEKIFGYTREEAVGQHSSFIVPEGTREQVKPIWEALVANRGGTRSTNANITKDGKIIIGEWYNNSLCDAEGNVVGVVSLVMDITEQVTAEKALRESEEKYRTVLENMEDIYFEVDLAGNFTFFNRALFDSLGYPPDNLLGMNYRNYMDGSNAGRIFKVFNQVYRTGEPTTVLDWELTKRDGSACFFETIVSVLRDSEGKRTGFRGIARNTTDRKRAETEKKELEEQLMQAQKMEAIGTLAGGVAHDFNNMLTPILGYGEMLLRSLAPGETMRKPVEQIHKAGLRAKDMIHQLLAFSRKQALSIRAVNLDAILTGFEPLLTSMLREDIRIDLKLSGSLPDIHVDAGQIEQVVMNLAVNAQDAMPGGGVITIETDVINLDAGNAKMLQAELTGNHVMMVVSDTGHGMDAMTLTRIFDPFFTTKGVGRGTGLGLATVFGIVKQHKSNIKVNSEPGKGTAFELYFPLAAAGQAAIEPVFESGEDIRGSETVLITEDDDAVRGLAESILTTHGYSVVSAASGADCLLLLSELDVKVDLLLTDVVMPDLNGKEIYKKVKEVCPDVKIVYMSGYTDDVIVHHGMLDPGVAFVQKPFSDRRLLSTLREVLDQTGG